MLRTLGLCALLSAPCLASPRDGDDWSEIWSAIDAWRNEDAGTRNARLPNRARELAVGRGDSLRSALLGALIGGPSAEAALEREIAILPPELEWPLNGRESWLAAEVLPAGAIRTQTAVSAMKLTPESWTSHRANLVNKYGVEAADDLRLEEAIAIQELLHDRYQAEWSAYNLALSLRWAGLYQRADRVLDEQLQLGASADLYSQRGLNALGSGNENRSRTYFGTALAKGSVNAALNLARLDLAAGDLSAARSGFRAILVNQPENPWSLRGWGISQVQEPLPPRTHRDSE